MLNRLCCYFQLPPMANCKTVKQGIDFSGQFSIVQGNAFDGQAYDQIVSRQLQATQTKIFPYHPLQTIAVNSTFQ